MENSFAKLDAERAATLAENGQRDDGPPRARDGNCPPPLPNEAYPEMNRAPERPRAAEMRASLRRASEIAPTLTSRYLVKGLLDQGGLSIAYGPSNVGKSFLVTDLGFHVGAGRDWHGQKVAKPPASVVYVASEGAQGVCNRIGALRLTDPELVAASNFYVLSMTLDLSQATDVEALITALTELPEPVSLLIVDTFARNLGAADENSAADIGRALRAIGRIQAATGAHVLLVHHAGKDTTKGARGSSATRAAVDTEIEIARDKDGAITAKPTKQRDMALGPAFTYQLATVDLGIDEDGDPVTSAVVEPTEPVAKRPKLTGQQGIAMQALDDAIAHHGERKSSDMFPRNRRLVTLDRWREYCRRHNLSTGNAESSFRAAFQKISKSLHENEIIRIVDGYVWGVFE